MKTMDMLNESFATARTLFWEKGSRMIPTIACLFIIPLMTGYLVELWRGGKPHSEDLSWGRLFVDGIKLFVLQIIYIIPLLIVGAIFFVGVLTNMTNQSPEAIITALMALMLGVVICCILYVIIVMLSTIGFVRFARTGRMGEAFSIGEIIRHIGRIGWLRYIWYLVVMLVVNLFGVLGLLMFFSFQIMPVIWLVLYPGVMIFGARFISLVYDQGVAPQATQA
jgi:hypothetical protein